eukprot:1335264-Pyramimonas_sp.AAC.1
MRLAVGVDDEEQGTSHGGGDDDPEEDKEDEEEEEELGYPFLWSRRARPARLAPRGALEEAVAPSCAARVAALTNERAASRCHT